MPVSPVNDVEQKAIVMCKVLQSGMELMQPLAIGVTLSDHCLNFVIQTL